MPSLLAPMVYCVEVLAELGYSDRRMDGRELEICTGLRNVSGTLLGAC